MTKWSTYEVCIDREIVEVLVQDVGKQVQVLALAHADVSYLYCSLHAVHNLGSLLLVMTIIERSSEGECLALAWLFE